jgi:hypothetical protein
MRYMLLIYSDESQAILYGTPEWDQLMVDYRAFTAEAQRRGTFIAGDPLQSVETATTLRLQDGKTAVLDGPFAETREQLGGYYLLDCKDKAEALELAEMIPTARYGSVEVRPMAGFETRYLEPERRTRYLLMFYGVEANYLPADDPGVVAGRVGHKRFSEALIERGEFIGGDALGLTKEATTVRVREGKVLHSDGPFAETREQLGGFYILNARDLDRMLELATRFPLGEDGSIEIRPLLDV